MTTASSLIGSRPAFVIAGRALSIAEAVSLLVGTRNLGFLSEARRIALLDRALHTRQISVDQQELQQACNDFRIARSLHSRSETLRWLQSVGMAEQEFWASLSWDLKIDKLKAVVVEGKVDAYFDDHPGDFDTVSIAEARTSDPRAARAFVKTVRESDNPVPKIVDFTDPVLHEGRTPVRTVRRGHLHPAVEAAVFTAKPGDMIGPIDTTNVSYVVKILATKKGELNPAVRNEIREQIFETWLESTETPDDDDHCRSSIDNPL